jgi:hypothetical protein
MRWRRWSPAPQSLDDLLDRFAAADEPHTACCVNMLRLARRRGARTIAGTYGVRTATYCCRARTVS